MTTPARMPNTRVPRSAAPATQKSTRDTRRSRRISARSIIPITTASMMRAARTGLGKAGEERRQEQQRQDHRDPRGQRREASPCPRPVVEGARRQARRDRHPLQQARADVRRRLGHGLLVHVDLVAVLGGEGPGVARRSGRSRSSPARTPPAGPSPRGRPAGPGPARQAWAVPGGCPRPRRHPRSSRSKAHEASSPPTSSTSDPGTWGATHRRPKTTARATPPTSTVVAFASPRVRSHEPSSWKELSPSLSVAVSLGSSPITTSMAAPNRNPVTTARERNCDSHPIRNTAIATNSRPLTSVIPATRVATSNPSERPVARTAPPATAASPELGPIEIWRQVPNSA